MNSETQLRWQDALLQVLEDWDGQVIITSPDIDGLLSAALLCSLRKSRLGGIYTTRYLILFDGLSRTQARNALWLDHDISHPGVRCIGQHLVLHKPEDRLPRRHSVSFNPNIYYRQAYSSSFKGKTGRQRDKYPFATIHFLMAALNIPKPRPGSFHYHLLAHADGAWKTPIDYPYNCQEWYRMMFDGNSIVRDLVGDYTRDEGGKARHYALVENLRGRGIAARASRINKASLTDRGWGRIEGNQSLTFGLNVKTATFLEKLQSVIQFISEQTNWSMAPPNSITDIIPGVVETPYPDLFSRQSFDEFMTEIEMFSHAFTGLRMLKYTTGIDLG